ncbi:MAG: nickel pincer cofactor biosynthesis protein LarB [Candidatus Binatia bacterium]
MNRRGLEDLLTRVQRGDESVAGALAALSDLPFVGSGFADLGFAKPDLHRELRTGVPEVIYGEGKTIEQIVVIAERLAADGQNALVTRLDPERAAALRVRLPALVHHPGARLAVLTATPVVLAGEGTILVASAGTADQPVAEEAACTAELMGNPVERLYDVGVAGLHRLLASRERLAAARVVVVVAGMEGALPSVVGGLVAAPVIAVPTSIGYGASFGGLAALLAMMNSCAAGVTVVNVDNGFGAGVAASRINRRRDG